MRLVTYDRRGARRLGATVAGIVVDLPDAVGHPAFPRTMEELVEHNGGSILAAARAAIEQPEAIAEFGVFHPRLLPPLVPASFLEPGTDGPLEAGPATRAVLGPGDALAWPKTIPFIACRVEVGCVVGRKARRVSARDAGRSVFGYTVMVQWSAVRGPGREGGGAPAGAAVGGGTSGGGASGGAPDDDGGHPPGRPFGAPFATSLGPWIVTPDEAELDGAAATAAIDGDVVATAILRPGGAGFAGLIAGASRDDEVGPGDVFGSMGFGASFDLTLARDATAGSVVEVAVEGIGSLATRVGIRRRRRGA